MKITELLIRDHEAFRRSLAELDHWATYPKKVGDPSRLIDAVRALKRDLASHAGLEDGFFFPALRAAVISSPGTFDARYFDHLVQEHSTVDTYADQLERAVSSTPPAWSWPQTFALLMHGLNVHLRKEERELFPFAEQALGAARLEELATEWRARSGDAGEA
jgi:hemerythrin-like domain-containing protein